ncbi:MAG TPA: HD domain-containing protein [Phnomibacter sp.]|nr:HD domain-containing protein [Phnomibacter sp.]
MPEACFDSIRKRVLKKLEALSPSLTYHSVDHTLDVVAQAERIATESGIGEREMFLLKVAGLYHDTGFLELYTGHEEKSCEYFLQDSPDYQFTESEEQIICGLIMATKVPQQPHSLLESILCDADLDYLGRADFDTIADSLKQELFSYRFVTSEEEWKRVQLSFLQSHSYHTAASIALREPEKRKRINLLAVQG